ncbi:Transcriptional regulator [Seminavis robusta]|uniref:Transcriptional regulator n=1 Tax=Seminavis robusta TaxID=568900 RepID=A0A9N8HNU5_9STRA|nr:Transcriptional regulator [Seminavis robusta]|eukprot:Sro1015_g231500.1 Transcriptional regulator (524) ;mRNA; f:12836-14706
MASGGGDERTNAILLLLLQQQQLQGGVGSVDQDAVTNSVLRQLLREQEDTQQAQQLQPPQPQQVSSGINSNESLNQIISALQGQQQQQQPAPEPLRLLQTNATVSQQQQQQQQLRIQSLQREQNLVTQQRQQIQRNQQQQAATPDTNVNNLLLQLANVISNQQQQRPQQDDRKMPAVAIPPIGNLEVSSNAPAAQSAALANLGYQTPRQGPPPAMAQMPPAQPVQSDGLAQLLQQFLQQQGGQSSTTVAAQAPVATIPQQVSSYPQLTTSMSSTPVQSSTISAGSSSAPAQGGIPNHSSSGPNLQLALQALHQGSGNTELMAKAANLIATHMLQQSQQQPGQVTSNQIQQALHYVGSSSVSTVTSPPENRNHAISSGSSNSTGSGGCGGQQNPANISSHPMEDIEYPGQHDVMFGRGGGASNHIGNINFRLMVENYKDRYAQASKLDKPKVADDVVRHWREKNPSGRFLTLTDPEEGTMSKWHDVGDVRARRKVAQALREKHGRCREESHDEEEQGPSTKRRG